MKKKLLFTILAIALMMSVFFAMSITASAAEYTSGYYTYTVSDGLATITRVDSNISGSVTIPSTLGGYKVATIGKGAFKDCKGIKSLTISGNVKTIGESAFENCAGLKTVQIPNNVTTLAGWAFYNCDGLTSVTIGTGLKSVDVFAFSECDSLESISLGKVTTIQTGAFYNCISLETINWGSALKNIEYVETWYYDEKGAFENCTGLTTVSIPNTVTDIGAASFYNCDGLRTVTIGNKVATIGKHAFKECSNVSRVTLGSAVQSIGEGAFENCSRLEKITIPDSVTTLAGWAFYNCNSLTSVTIGTGLKSVDVFAFSECVNLQSVSLGGVATIQTGAFYNCTSLKTITWGNALKVIEYVETWYYDEKGAFENCAALTTVAIPNTVTDIGQNAFYNCDGLKTLTIGNKVTTIGNYAFKDCENLSSITIGDSVTSMGDAVFERSSVKTIKIPDSVTTMGGWVFYNCDSLTSATIGSGLTEVAMFTFAECDNLKSVSLGGVTKIQTGAFYNCVSLSTINWSNALKSIEYVESWYYDERGAFENCISLKSIVLPDKITTIGQKAFKNCTGLTSVYFCSKLQTIGYEAFVGCNSQTVYYEGSKSDWTYVVIENGNDAITSATVKYNCDTKKPGATISATNNVAASQTVTLKMTDNVGVVKYYWGTSSAPASSAYTSITTTVSKSVTKTVSSAGTYYLIVKDAAGHTTTASVTFYKTTLNANGGKVSPSYVITKSGNSFTPPSATRSGYTYLGWATSSTAKSVGYKSSYKPTKSQTLYAVYTIFPDVPRNAWYYDAVEFAAKNGYITGYKNGKFGAADSITRQDFVVILARASGVNLSKYSGRTAFKDVPAGSYYEAAVKWASSNKIVSGYSNGKFGVGDKLTREQLVTILYNYAKLKGCNMSVTAASKAKLKAFSDSYKVTGYAQTPCAWALQNGVLGGLNATTFGPQNYANRAQVAQILMNIVKNKVIPF